MKPWIAVHKWTSLVCMVFALILCITGLPLVFSHEIDHLLGNTVDPPALAEGAAKQRIPLSAILADARSKAPGEKLQFVFPDEHSPEVMFVRFGHTFAAPEASTVLSYDLRTGQLLSEYPVGEGLMHVLFKLHVDLFAGLPGTLFLGAMGLVLIAAVISGVVVYGPFMRRLHFGTVRMTRSSRLKWLDVHNLLGIVTAAWLTVVAATGVVNTLSIPIFARWQSQELSALVARSGDGPKARSAESVPVDRVLAAAEHATGGRTLSFLALPGTRFSSPGHFVAFMRGKTPVTESLLTAVLVAADTGKVAATSQMPWYVSALLLSQPLHFGDYGGLPLKVLWAVLDVATIVVLGSGIYLWLVHRRRPVEERLAKASASPVRRHVAPSA